MPSSRGRIHFVRWWSNPRWVWGYSRFYGYDSTYYALSFGKFSIQLERPDRVEVVLEYAEWYVETHKDPRSK